MRTHSVGFSLPFSLSLSLSLNVAVNRHCKWIYDTRKARSYHVSGDGPPVTWRWEFAWESTGSTVQLEDNGYNGRINGTSLRQSCFFFNGDKIGVKDKEESVGVTLGRFVISKREKRKEREAKKKYGLKEL